LIEQKDAVIAHFLTVNRIASIKASDEVTSQHRSTFQQWMSLAYSLQLFASYVPFTAVDPTGAKFNDRSDFKQIVLAARAPGLAKAARHKKSPGSKRRVEAKK
jgi:hypothetical protein